LVLPTTSFVEFQSAVFDFELSLQDHPEDC